MGDFDAAELVRREFDLYFERQLYIAKQGWLPPASYDDADVVGSFLGRIETFKVPTLSTQRPAQSSARSISLGGIGAS